MAAQLWSLSGHTGQEQTKTRRKLTRKKEEVLLSKGREYRAIVFLLQIAFLLSRHQPGHCPTGRLLQGLRSSVAVQLGSALLPANNQDLVNSGLPEEVSECFLSFKWFQIQPLQRAESSLIIKETTSEEQATVLLSILMTKSPLSRKFSCGFDLNSSSSTSHLLFLLSNFEENGGPIPVLVLLCFWLSLS